MSIRSVQLFSVGLVLAAGGLASAFSGHPAASAQPAVSVVPASFEAPSAPTALSTPVDAPVAGMPIADDGDEVNCGKVGPDGGRQVDLIADATQAGTVGCDEAVNVVTEYYHAAAKTVPGDGTARIRDIGTWTCLMDGGEIACGSDDGRALHTLP
jgi:hypothetical protein